MVLNAGGRGITIPRPGIVFAPPLFYLHADAFGAIEQPPQVKAGKIVVGM
jgi:hypothetical protein